MNIIAKATIEKDILDAKIKDGVNKIEIQLLRDFMEDSISLEEYLQRTISSDVDVINVHTPLLGKEEFNLESFTIDKNKHIFLKSCELSQMYANHYGHDIILIVHNSFTLKMYQSIDALLKEIIQLFEYVIKTYPNVIISFENVIPFHFSNRFTGRGGFLNDSVELAKYFNKVCSKPIFGTTLDTCHVLTTLRYLSMFEKEEKFREFNIDMEYFFRENKDTINNIHLCNLKNLGIGPFEHGTAFDIEIEEDREILKDILILYKKYNYKAPLTLEVFEIDYLNCKNFRKTRFAVKEVSRMIEGA